MFYSLVEASAPVETFMSAGLYIRLSKEDEKDGPSESVVNQQILLEQFARENQYSVYDIYIDDGWSGCNFDRPDFQRLLADIEAGYVNTVITKDLSRLGRDYILTGHYLERYFPEHKVRYISLIDGIDTGCDSSHNDITPFRAIMNDLYARDISRKITAVKRDKQRRGEFIGGKPVYGYRMHPTEKNRIVIDEPSAAVVRRIFELAMHTDSCRAVAEILNADSVPSPSVYANLKTQTKWSGERIREILQNEIYLGNMVQGRRAKASYKSKKCIRREMADWIIVPNTHDAIVDPETFQAVQNILSTRKRTRRRVYIHPLKGILHCSDCHRPLSLINRRNSSGDDTLYFLCRTGQKRDHTQKCVQRCVKAEAITNTVISELLSIYEKELSCDHIAEIATGYFSRESEQDTDSPRSSLDLQLKQVNEKIDRMYMDQLDQLVERADFDRIYRELCIRRNNLLNKISQQQSNSHNTVSTALAPEMARQFIATLKDNQELLSLLIERIDLTADKKLHITYRSNN